MYVTKSIQFVLESDSVHKEESILRVERLRVLRSLITGQLYLKIFMNSGVELQVILYSCELLPSYLLINKGYLLGH